MPVYRITRENEKDNCDEAISVKWDEYVERSDNCTLFHYFGWKRVIEKTFGHKPYYLLLEDNGKVKGILPMFLIRSILFGKQLVSSPCSVYGGVCADNADAEKALMEEAITIADSEDAKYIEFRNFNRKSIDLPEKDLYCTFIRALPDAPDKCLGMFPRKARAAVRKGIQYELEAEFGLDKTEEFYSLYAQNKRDLGSPYLPFSFFKNWITEFGEQSNILYVKYHGRTVACVLTFFFKDIVSPQCSGCLPEYNKYQTNNFMYFKLMEYGVKNGYRWFDFGRSRKDTGAYHFKRHQGFEPQQLHYQYYLNTVSKMPDLSPSARKFSIVKLIWKRLPVALSNTLSSKFGRQIPY